MEISEQLKEIRSHYRRAMNGVVSQSMRQKGTNYRVNFGIELPRLRDIASRYAPDHRLAQALWKDPIRESQILATLLQPVEQFSPELCDIWMEEITEQEIAELACFHLFRRLPYASEKAFAWMASDEPLRQGTGFLLMTHLLTKGATLSPRSQEEFLDQALTALQTEPNFPRRTALNALRRFAENEENYKALMRYSSALNDQLKGLIEAL